jgi:hypothetical protein
LWGSPLPPSTGSGGCRTAARFTSNQRSAGHFDLRITAHAPAVGLHERLVDKIGREASHVPEPRTGDNSKKGEGVRDLIAWLAVLLALVWLWKNR